MANYSPYIKILDSQKAVLNLQLRSLEYTYSESLEDHSKVVLESNNTTDVDTTEIQEDQSIHIVWGYVGIPHTETIRKVFIIDSKCEFTNTGVKITLRCLPKATYLKYNAKSVVRNNTSIPNLVEELGGRLGIGVENLVDTQESTSQVVKTGFSKPAELLYDVYNNPNDPNDPRNGNIVRRGISSASDSARVRRDYSWKTYSSIPQNNQSDAQLLNAMQKLEPLDNLVISGRDDNITIKQRDFSQTPVILYRWGGENGTLLSITTSINNTFNKPRAMLTSTDGWDSLNKTFIQGDVKNTLEGSTLLGSKLNVNIEESLNTEVSGYPGNVKYYGLFEEYNTEDSEGNKISSFIRNDELNGNSKFVFREKKGYVPGKFSKDGYLLEQDVVSRVELKGVIPVRYAKHMSTIEDNSADIAGAGIEERSSRTLEMYRCSASAIGNPNLTEGKIIRITGIGRKYSGNWYITKARHEVDTKGWIVHMDISRNAQGPTEDTLPGLQTAENLNRVVNGITSEIGEDLVSPSKIDDL